MIRQNWLRLIWLGAGLLIAAGANAQPKPDSLAQLKAQADSISAVIGRAILQQDSALLASCLSDTVGIVLPGGKTTNGRQNVGKYTPLLFQTVGGATLKTTRIDIEKIADYNGIARQAGHYTMTRTDAAGKEEKWQGRYSIYWRYTDTTWAIERLFVSKR